MHRLARRTGGTETSQYLEEETTTVIPQVAASERGGAQTVRGRPRAGLWDTGRVQPGELPSGGLVEGRGNGRQRRGEPGRRKPTRLSDRRTRVPRDTRNPVGSRGDQPQRLKLPW